MTHSFHVYTVGLAQQSQPSFHKLESRICSGLGSRADCSPVWLSSLGGDGETHLFFLLPRWADAESVLQPWTKVVGRHRARGSGQKRSHLAGLQSAALITKLQAHSLLHVCHMAGSGDPEMVRTPASSWGSSWSGKRDKEARKHDVEC